LPARVLADIPREHQLRIPMLTTRRSLNLANAVAIAVYEAWRQSGFPQKTNTHVENTLFPD
jgi:tRNA (cytidine/uridine-2'-O-)-methyltransferase